MTKKVFDLLPDENTISLIFYIEGERKDSCSVSQASYVLRKFFGAIPENAVPNPESPMLEFLESTLREFKRYWTDEDTGELMDYDYRVRCTGVVGDHDWNGALSERLGYSYYKKLRDAGFMSGIAAKLGITKALIDIIPERNEILDLLDLKQKYE